VNPIHMHARWLREENEEVRQSQRSVRWCLGCGQDYECSCEHGDVCRHHTCDETDPEYPA
jgi:hypothetical protein